LQSRVFLIFEIAFMEHHIVFGVLILALVLFAWGRIRHDFVALISLSVLLIFGVVEPDKAFKGTAAQRILFEYRLAGYCFAGSYDTCWRCA